MTALRELWTVILDIAAEGDAWAHLAAWWRVLTGAVHAGDPAGEVIR